MARRVLRSAAGAAAVLVFASCGGGADEEPVADADLSAERSVILDVEATVPVLVDPDLNPEGVIFAAIILGTGGDVDLAMADGMFTRDDLDAARDGIADGSLNYLFD